MNIIIITSEKTWIKTDFLQMWTIFRYALKLSNDLSSKALILPSGYNAALYNKIYFDSQLSTNIYHTFLNNLHLYLYF